jgi:glutathione peroxidase
MTLRQLILKHIYPFLVNKKNEKGILYAPETAKANENFYNLNATLNNGSTFSFETLRGKKVIIVNTASNCGYTAQYAELEAIYQQYKESVYILAFPSNNFKAQETGTDQAIASFCTINYGIHFLLMQKTVVIPHTDQHTVYQWLCSAQKNGWNNQPPKWNFCKYIVDETGCLKAFVPQQISPLNKAFMALLTA